MFACMRALFGERGGGVGGDGEKRKSEREREERGAAVREVSKNYFFRAGVFSPSFSSPTLFVSSFFLFFHSIFSLSFPPSRRENMPPVRSRTSRQTLAVAGAAGAAAYGAW